MRVRPRADAVHALTPPFWVGDAVCHEVPDGGPAAAAPQGRAQASSQGHITSCPVLWLVLGSEGAGCILTQYVHTLRLQAYLRV